jgi:hypothetical protein
MRGEAGRRVAANRFEHELAATGMLSAVDVETRLNVSRKTIAKHVRAGHLVGETREVAGRLMWLFSPAEVKAYGKKLPGLMRFAVHEKANRPGSVESEPGWLTFAEMSTELGVSHWTLRENFPATIPLRRGRHGKKFMHESYLPELGEALVGLHARPRKTINEMDGPPPQRGRIKGGPWFDVFEELWVVMRIQPEFTAEEIRRLTGASRQAAERWKSGERIPSERYRGALVARFREAFLCRLGDELLGYAIERRLDYVRDKMQRRRG